MIYWELPTLRDRNKNKGVEEVEKLSRTFL